MPATQLLTKLSLESNTLNTPTCRRYTTKPWLNLLKGQVAELKGPVTTFKEQYVPDWNDTDSTDTKVAAVRPDLRGCQAMGICWAAILLIRLAGLDCFSTGQAADGVHPARPHNLLPPSPALLSCPTFATPPRSTPS